MKAFIISFTILSIIFFSVPMKLNSATTAIYSGDTCELKVTKVIDWINDMRRVKGLPIVKENVQLDESSWDKLTMLIVDNYFAHYRIDPEREVWGLFKSFGYNYVEGGELLAYGFDNPKELFNAWMNSPEHHALLVNPMFKDYGLSCEEVNGYVGMTHPTTLIVLHLGVRN